MSTIARTTLSASRGLSLRPPRVSGRKDAMKTYTGTMTPNRRDLSDPRSSGRPQPTTRTPLLNDRRSTR
jgi:hypothetical protein